MRYVIYGAGGIGGGIGARLFRAGHDVILIARGAQLEAIRRDGLTIRTPDEAWTAAIPIAGHPAEIDFRADDVVLLAMKSQDTAAALDDLEAAAGPEVPVFCAQNGVANERMAIRRFARVYAMLVNLPATYLQPGRVDLHATPVSGVLDTGRFPRGTDSLVERVAADLSASGFESQPHERAISLKYGKLLGNLRNALQALCGPNTKAPEITEALDREAIACYDAAGIDYTPAAQIASRRAAAFRVGTIAGGARGGGSTWQSLARGLPTVETDYLNGEIVQLGALHDVPTPWNRTLQLATNAALRRGAAPGTTTPQQLHDQAAALLGAAQEGSPA